MSEDRIHYEPKLRCLNCGHIWQECILFGTLVVDHIKEHGIECTNCKCDDARVIPDGRTE